MKVYYIANAHKTKFFRVKKSYNKYKGLISNQGMQPFADEKYCLAAWYSPLGTDSIYGTQTLPCKVPDEQLTEDFYIYSLDVNTKTEKRAKLLDINHRYIEFDDYDTRTTGEVLCFSRELLQYGCFYKDSPLGRTEYWISTALLYENFDD